jgi:hypothetical protein
VDRLNGLLPGCAGELHGLLNRLLRLDGKVVEVHIALIVLVSDSTLMVNANFVPKVQRG